MSIKWIFYGVGNFHVANQPCKIQRSFSGIVFKLHVSSGFNQITGKMRVLVSHCGPMQSTSSIHINRIEVCAV